MKWQQNWRDRILETKTVSATVLDQIPYSTDSAPHGVMTTLEKLTKFEKENICCTKNYTSHWSLH